MVLFSLALLVYTTSCNRLLLVVLGPREPVRIEKEKNENIIAIEVT